VIESRSAASGEDNGVVNDANDRLGTASRARSIAYLRDHDVDVIVIGGRSESVV
jgi:hypothetical protein